MQSTLKFLRFPGVVLQRRFNSYSNGSQDLASRLAASLEPYSDAPESHPPSAGFSGYPKPTPTRANPLDESNISQYRSEVPRYRLHCHSSRNNTITTFTMPNGHTLAWFSGGSCGFKKGNRASYEAGYQCAVRMFKQIETAAEKEPFEIDLFFKGFGQGREALQKALLSGEGDNIRMLVCNVTDRTPLKIGGTRSKKARRL
ncbi:hypothetical protein AX15_004700 [Amanita polypyramis BW_CC]|nr:hypothetical protein AX15_004700 [Amanita polypyramis BW_CC]